jgi:maltose O-acetyltransferase
MHRLRTWWPGLWRNIYLNGIVASSLTPMPLRWRLLRSYGADVAPSKISPGVWIGSNRLTIGEGAFINTGCMLSTHSRITIGRRAYLAMRVTVSTSSHEIGSSETRAGKLTTAPVTIGDGCWIGANVTILPGVTIGSGTVIASGAVVTADCEPDSLYAGVPAVRKRALDTEPAQA